MPLPLSLPPDPDRPGLSQGGDEVDVDEEDDVEDEEVDEDVDVVEDEDDEDEDDEEDDEDEDVPESSPWASPSGASRSRRDMVQAALRMVDLECPPGAYNGPRTGVERSPLQWARG